MYRNLGRAGALAIIIAAGAIAVAGQGREQFSPYVDDTGAITLPDPMTVREKWSSLGTWVVQGDNGAEELHLVYTQPGTIDAFSKTKQFPDGSVLVKEVRKAAQGTRTTGHVAWSGEEVLWFVMVKDRKGRFAENAIWAKGWGWGLFLAEDPATNVATDFGNDCMTCHEPAQNSDWVYQEGYPVLQNGISPP
jgi:hypothetical protein